MRAIVGPDIPVVIGLSFEVLPVLVVQKGNYFIQHGLGDRGACAELRPCKLEGKIGANAFACNKIREVWVRPDTGGGMKFDTLVDALADHVTHGSLKTRLGQRLAVFQIALVKEVVAWGCHPVDVLEPAADADPGTVFGVVRVGGGAPAAPQLRERRLFVLAGPFDIHYCVTRDAPFAL